MQPEERDPAYLWDIIEAARAIAAFTENLTLEEFLAAGRDREVTRMVVERGLEILGEAARNVHKAIKMHGRGWPEHKLPVPRSHSFAEYIAIPV